jgi:hypothetical protein
MNGYRIVGMALIVPCAFAGCVARGADLYTCDTPDIEHSFDGKFDPCDAGSDAGEDASDAGADAEEDADGGPSKCSGECLPSNPLGIGEGTPLVLRVGLDEQNTAPCPTNAPVPIFEGRGVFSVGESACPSCSCGPSAGTCALSSSIAAFAAPKCNVDAPKTPTNAPPGWDGACTNASPIKAGVTCAGALCVQSVEVGEVSIADACEPEPSKDGPVFPAPLWGMFGRACAYDQSSCDTAQVCVPEPYSEFACLTWHGERDCPTDPLEKYNKRFVLYSGFKDTRACSSCACGTPAASWCSSSVTLFEDGSCTQPINTVNAGSNGAACNDFNNPPGLAIGSKSATLPLYHAGTCAASGGELVGSAEPIEPITFCCREPPHPG